MWRPSRSRAARSRSCATGIRSKLDVDARTIELELDPAEVERRRADLPDPAPRYARGYGRLYIDHVMQADAGCDFDFLRAPRVRPRSRSRWAWSVARSAAGSSGGHSAVG